MDSDFNESTRLLDAQGRQDEQEHAIRRNLLWRLYISHFLSTWNMRSYEFTVILLFTKAYPNTLLPTSIRGVITNGATLLLSPAIGRWVDRNASRFYTIKITIVVQRVCVVLGCMLWILLLVTPLAGTQSSPSDRAVGLSTGSNSSGLDKLVSKNLIVAVLVVFGTVERMCAVGNNLVMERDWVPTIASEVSDPPLHRLNAVMRRIDLVSKILAPVFVSAIQIGTGPAVLALITAIINLVTVGIELLAAKSAWDTCNILKVSREAKPTGNRALLTQEERDQQQPEDETSYEVVARTASEPTGLRLYFSSDAWLASLSVALQSFSVLSLSGPMTTYLLTRHYSLSLITAARTATSIVEIASTLIFPLAANLLTRARRSPTFSFLVPNSDPMAALGIGGVSLQLLLLVPCFVALFTVPVPSSQDPDVGQDPATLYPFATAAIFAFLGLSRVGHWIHNMAVQQIVQTRVSPAHRVEFSGVEMTFISAAEIGRWGAAVIWSRPDQFGGIAAGGLGSVVVIWCLFAAWLFRVRRARMHREGGA